MESQKTLIAKQIFKKENKAEASHLPKWVKHLM